MHSIRTDLTEALQKGMNGCSYSLLEPEPARKTNGIFDIFFVFLFFLECPAQKTLFYE
jgi:hypothetical protein